MASSSSTSRQSIPAVPRSHARRVVHGFALPDDRPDLTANERAWIVTLRAIAGDADPPVTLARVQALRRALVRA